MFQESRPSRCPIEGELHRLRYAGEAQDQQGVANRQEGPYGSGEGTLARAAASELGLEVGFVERKALCEQEVRDQHRSKDGVSPRAPAQVAAALVADLLTGGHPSIMHPTLAQCDSP